MEKRYEEFIGDNGYSRKFLKEWVSRGERTSTDEEYSYLTTFFCYFVAFNYLFNTFSYTVYNDKNCGEEKQIKRFIEFCSSNENKIEYGLEGFDPLPLLNPDAELFTVVHDGRLCKSVHKRNNTEDEEKPIVRLFRNIYRVRCNLFHGSKSMFRLRDSNLVKESNIVLKNLLDCFM